MEKKEKWNGYSLGMEADLEKRGYRGTGSHGYRSLGFYSGLGYGQGPSVELGP